MKPQWLWQFVVLLVLFLCQSCIGVEPCGEEYCPSLPKDFQHLIPEIGDTLTFRNQFGNEINFMVAYAEFVDEAFTLDNDKCDQMCPIPGRFFSSTENQNHQAIDTTDSSVKTLRDLRCFLNVYRSLTSMPVQCQIFGSWCEFNLSPYIPIGSHQTFLDSISFENHTYKNILVHEFDTTSSEGQLYRELNRQFIWKIYFNRGIGVVGYYDLTDHTEYFRVL